MNKLDKMARGYGRVAREAFRAGAEFARKYEAWPQDEGDSDEAAATAKEAQELRALLVEEEAECVRRGAELDRVQAELATEVERREAMWQGLLKLTDVLGVHHGQGIVPLTPKALVALSEEAQAKLLGMREENREFRQQIEAATLQLLEEETQRDAHQARAEEVRGRHNALQGVLQQVVTALGLSASVSEVALVDVQEDALAQTEAWRAEMRLNQTLLDRVGERLFSIAGALAGIPGTRDDTVDFRSDIPHYLKALESVVEQVTTAEQAPAETS